MTTVYRTPGEVEKNVENIELSKKEEKPEPPNPTAWFVGTVLALEAMVAYYMGLTFSVFVYLGLADAGALCLLLGIANAQIAAAARDVEKEKLRRWKAFAFSAINKESGWDKEKLMMALLKANADTLAPKEAEQVADWIRSKG